LTEFKTNCIKNWKEGVKGSRDPPCVGRQLYEATKQNVSNKVILEIQRRNGDPHRVEDRGECSDYQRLAIEIIREESSLEIAVV
jgi:hypothetical protein